MTDPLISKAEQHDYRQLFLQDLHWSAPDHTPIDYSADGRTVTATNVSSYKGLRVWVCDEKPGSQLEAQLDREIAKTSTDRLVIFYEGVDQVWRWPVRRIKGAATITRLTSHRHHTGTPNPKFEARLEAIRLPLDRALDPNAVLAKVRAAFDVETQNETKQASKLMARMYAAMEKAYPSDHDRAAHDHQISVTLARILFLIFGDDTDMWTEDLFRDFIHNHTEADGSDIGGQLNHLFIYLDTPPAQRHDATAQLKDFPYINGGIFRERVTLPEVNAEFRVAILDACAVDWSTISPAIFGSMFQSVRDAKTRRELGEHYTSEESILKTLNPLFLDELRDDFEHARTMKNEALALRRLRDRLGEIRYMDPACGCGNFIIVAYRELRDLELAIMERLQEITGDGEMLLANVGLKVTLDHFYGIEIDEWPAKIAETAMFLIDRQCDLKLTERLGWAPDRLPITITAHIHTANALHLDWAEACPPSKHVIVSGNPPFSGRGDRSAAQTVDQKVIWGKQYNINLDYVTCWYLKAVEFFADSTGRWAFVSTSSVCQGEAVATLWRPILDAGWRCRFAHRSMQWDSDAPGKAAVHVSIVGFDKAESSPKPTLWTYPEGGQGEGTPQSVVLINPYLVEGPNVLILKRSKPLTSQLPEAAFGSMANDGGHLLVEVDEYPEVADDPVASKYLRPFIGAKELLHNRQRWCLWMVNLAPADLGRSGILRDRIAAVRDHRAKSLSPTTSMRIHPPELFGQIAQPGTSYLAIPRHVSEYRRFYLAARYEADVICGDANFLIPDPDGFALGVISSTMFMTWQKTIGGRLKSDLRFSKTFTYNTFPFPSLSKGNYEAICAAAAGVVEARLLFPGVTLADLYNPRATPLPILKAHDGVDRAMDEAFQSNTRIDTIRDRQKLLFNRYEELTSPLFASASKGRRK
jgi:hypothetical protein